jgi:hypothetical protein
MKTKTYAALPLGLKLCFVLVFSLSIQEMSAEDKSESADKDKSVDAIVIHILKPAYGNEWVYNRNGRTNEPPLLGLALSGGGMRSATFSIGILHGLSDIGILTNVDILSSVSGGGYAASWYYIQNLASNVPAETLFDPHGNYQRYIETHGELVGHTSAKEWYLRQPEYVLYDGGLTIGSWPFNFLANGLFGCKANLAPVRRIYQQGIERIFDVVPNGKGRRSALDGKLWDASGLLGRNPPRHEEFSALATNIIGDIPGISWLPKRRHLTET